MSGESIPQALTRIAGSDMSDDAKIASLIGACMSQNYREYAAVAQPLINQLQQENEKLRTELETIRRLITGAFKGRYVPSPDYVISCLYPPETTEFINGGEA